MAGDNRRGITQKEKEKNLRWDDNKVYTETEKAAKNMGDNKPNIKKRKAKEGGKKERKTKKNKKKKRKSGYPKYTRQIGYSMSNEPA